MTHDDKKGTTNMRYKFLGRSGLRVSEICLGTMSFGQDWPFGADEATSHRILDVYAEAGGNFLDTANKYHNGQTEEYLGRWLKDRRKRMVIATKYSLAMDHSDPNAAGNHRKNLMQAVEDSLRGGGDDERQALRHHWSPGLSGAARAPLGGSPEELGVGGTQVQHAGVDLQEVVHVMHALLVLLERLAGRGALRLAG
jgi:aryl-alcohol dehydrogenase-like predicted oxidoreductase